MLKAYKYRIYLNKEQKAKTFRCCRFVYNQTLSKYKSKHNNKLETISKLFEDSEIRSVWDSEKEEYYFSVVDVVGALTKSDRARKYWNDLKIKLSQEGS